MQFSFQQVTAKWKNHDPIAYQQWQGANNLKYYVAWKVNTDCPISTFETITNQWNPGYDIKLVQEHMWRNRNCPRFTYQQRNLFYQDRSLRCFRLLLYNMINPTWSSVNCSEPSSASHVFCMKDKDQVMKSEFVSQEKYCLSNDISENGTCYRFQWTKFDRQANKKAHCFSQFKDFQYLFDAIQANSFPPIFINKLKYMTFSRYFNVYDHKIHFIKNISEALCITQSFPKRVSPKGNLFECHNKAMISALHVCDGFDDCPEDKASDEVTCNCTAKQKNTTLCKNIISENQTRECSPLFYNTHDGRCEMLTDNDAMKQKMETHPLQCTTGTPIPRDLVNDLVVDCFPDGEDEPHLMSLVLDDDYFPCAEPGEIPCREGHTKCYNVSEICKYNLNSAGYLIPCRTGEHLQECKHFECITMFKCPMFYCIPWHYVCNSKWDCPKGVDENVGQCGRRICSHLLKCKRHQVCIHFDHVCDGIPHCPLADDETLCKLHGVDCPLNCHCLTFAVFCSHMNLSTHQLKHFSHFLLVTVEASQLIPKYQINLTNAIFLSLSQTNLQDLCFMLEGHNHIQSVVVSCNEIRSLCTQCFHFTRKVKSIDISRNYITKVQSSIFVDLTSLKTLNLSHNPLKSIKKLFFCPSELKILSLLCVADIVVSDDVFKDLSVETLETNNFVFCCFVSKQTRCSINIPWFQSCSDLLMNTAIKITFYAISTLIFLLNLVALIFTCSDKAYGYLAASVNVSDITCCVPLKFLWISDLVLKGTFVAFSSEWKSSPSCFVVLGLLFFFGLLSPTILCLFGIARFKIVDSPLNSKFKESQFVLHWVAGIFVSCLYVAFMFAILTWILDKYLSFEFLPTAICSPFADPTKSTLMIQVSTWLVGIFQIIGTLFIITIYTSLVKSLKKSQQNIQSSASRKQSNIYLYTNLLVLSTSCVLCWIPSALIYLVSMFLPQYPLEMVSWATISINTINSIVNPVLFISTPLRRKAEKQFNETDLKILQ